MRRIWIVCSPVLSFPQVTTLCAAYMTEFCGFFLKLHWNLNDVSPVLRQLKLSLNFANPFFGSRSIYQCEITYKSSNIKNEMCDGALSIIVFIWISTNLASRCFARNLPSVSFDDSVAIFIVQFTTATRLLTASVKFALFSAFAGLRASSERLVAPLLLLALYSYFRLVPSLSTWE